MAKTGSNDAPGTAEGAAMGRAMHMQHSSAPILCDDWALRLLSPGGRETVLTSDSEAAMWQMADFDASGMFAINVGSLRYAEEAVEAAVADGIDQYLVLGAGLDSFALRRADMAGRLTVFEVDHPDVQALKRERIAAADALPAALPTFIPVDFEQQSLGEAVAPSAFDSHRPAIVSWVNTLHYLTADATRATLAELAGLLAPGSRLVLNYPVEVPLTPAQTAYRDTFLAFLSLTDEPFQSRWTPGDFAAVLREHGFGLREHVTEEDLVERFFSGRDDGLRPGLPLRALIAERL